MNFHKNILLSFLLISSITCQSQDLPSQIYEDAYTAYDNSKFKQAINLYESINEQYKDSVDYHLILGICYSEEGNNEAAIEAYNRSLAIDIDFEQAYIQRGISYFSISENSKAIKDFKQAILINPDNPDVYLNLGTVQYESGDIEGACSQWKVARDLGLDIASQMIDEVCK